MRHVETNIDFGVATVHLCDQESNNALSTPLVDALNEALENVAADPDCRVVLLRGLREVFCAGATKEMLLALARGELMPHEIRLAGALLDVPVPVVAAMEGHAVGGGFAVGLSADIVLMARESRYGCNFVDLGITPGMGTTRLLEHVLSPALAHELLFTGELRRGSAFAAHGGVNYVLPRDEVLSKAQSVAARIAEKPRLVLETLKRTLSIGRRAAFEEARTLEALMHNVALQRDGLLEHIEANYVE